MTALDPSEQTPAPATANPQDPMSPCLAALADNKLRLLTALRDAGVVQATISYFGEGDSGSVTNVDAIGAHNTTIVIPNHRVAYSHCVTVFDGQQWMPQAHIEDVSLEDALRAFTDYAVSLHHEGYENNDGGSGEVIFDCEAGTVRLEHVDYYTESSCTDTDL